MCIYVYVYTCIYMCICVYVYMCMCIGVYVYVYVYVYEYVYEYVYVYVYVYVCIHICTPFREYVEPPQMWLNLRDLFLEPIREGVGKIDNPYTNVILVLCKHIYGKHPK